MCHTSLLSSHVPVPHGIPCEIRPQQTLLLTCRVHGTENISEVFWLTCFVFIALMLFYALMINTIPSLFLQHEFCLLVGSFLVFMLLLTSITSLNIFDTPPIPPTHTYFFLFCFVLPIVWIGLSSLDLWTLCISILLPKNYNCPGKTYYV